jgi:hypothetical protein
MESFRFRLIMPYNPIKLGLVVLFAFVMLVKAYESSGDGLTTEDSIVTFTQECKFGHCFKNFSLQKYFQIKILKDQKVFKLMRLQHNEAVRRLMALKDLEKQKEMVHVLIDRLHDLLKDTKKTIGAFGSFEALITTSIADESTRTGIFFDGDTVT